MFDFRYHALSLAAVLLALAVGVVIGVAIGDSDLVSSAKSGIVHDLKEEVAGAQHHAGELGTQLAGEEAFANDLYPIAVHGLLDGENVGLVFLGGSSNSLNTYVRDAVTQAGGSLATVVAIREPLDLEGLAHAAEGTRFASLDAESSRTPGEGGEANGKLIESFGSIVGKQLVSGGSKVERELISRVRGPLLSAFDGQLGKLDALVVVRNEPTSATPEQSSAATQFESGLIDGVTAVGIPLVGAETTSTEPSQVPWYQSKDISSVDDVEQTAGQAALIYALNGSHGSYGTKATADSLLPNVVGASSQP
ncbi:MAG TPA: copper transporter [Solirubrobacteraceae bacterium]|nr:copper transporter [Solirubrobacteraceae bacterium]